MNTRAQETAVYAAAVRAALADVPEADREELLDDLEEHLAEVAAESAEPLVSRLGAPESYAAELRAAYGADSARAKGVPSWALLRDNVKALERRLRRLSGDGRGHRYVWVYLRELRPFWWVARAYVVALLIWRFTDATWHLNPWGSMEYAILLVLAACSVVVGVRGREGRLPTPLSGAVVAGNALAIGALLVFPAVAGLAVVSRDGSAPTPQYAGESGGGDMSAVTNIQPYSKDGRPLKDVLLYDQRGGPLQVPYDQDGLVLSRVCGSPPPIANAYPLPLRTPTEEGGTGEPGDASPCVPAGPTESPSKSASPSPSGTRSEPAPTPVPSPTG